MIFILKYDGSFEGFLTCVFEVYERKIDKVSICKSTIATDTFFEVCETVITEERKAERVWKGLKKKCSSAGTSNIYRAFLSEYDDIENTLLEYIRYAFKSLKSIDGDYGNKHVLRTSKVAKMVRREKHRMDAFVRFRLTKDGIYFATIEPDFNVLPLNLKHFKNRYADQRWIIYDLKRKYGLYYNLKTVETICIDLDRSINISEKNSNYFTLEEFDYQNLWKNYFKSTNIKSRKNMKLHVRHVPKRYWKYLSEKNPQ
ncbi:DNA metabolism protein [Patiriisocius marinistellae]|uniref:DNA metabolism protein n=1 Tax=Patiriisocius marinistellae TaxID=2494560 RepID=A0A5J4G295_9FLAO|nr:TIGR03915 family putative DNA repair protein [Patiriisocius marinistellae]GEQ86879.1 DNA metabolism protein [Patiriisocius marinistellae]